MVCNWQWFIAKDVLDYSMFCYESTLSTLDHLLWCMNLSSITIRRPSPECFYQMIFQTCFTLRRTGAYAKRVPLEPGRVLWRTCLTWKRKVALLKALPDSSKNGGSVGAFLSLNSVLRLFTYFRKDVKGHSFELLFNLINGILIPCLNGSDFDASRCNCTWLSINVKSPRHRWVVGSNSWWLMVSSPQRKNPKKAVTHAACSKQSIYGDK